MITTSGALKWFMKPTRIIELITYYWIIMSIFVSFYSKHYYIVLILISLRLTIAKQYKQIPISLAFYGLVYVVIRYLGFWGLVTVISFILIPFMIKIFKKGDKIWDDAMNDKNKTALYILEQSRKNQKDTPFMKELREKINNHEVKNGK